MDYLESYMDLRSFQKWRRDIKKKSQLKNPFFRQEIYKKYGNKCAHCGLSLKYDSSKSNLVIHHKRYDWYCPKTTKIIIMDYLRKEIKNLEELFLLIKGETNIPKIQLLKLARGRYVLEVDCINCPKEFFEKCIDNCELLCVDCHEKEGIKNKEKTGDWCGRTGVNPDIFDGDVGACGNCGAKIEKEFKICPNCNKRFNSSTTY